MKILILLRTIIASGAEASTQAAGQRIPVSLVQNTFNTALIETETEWCTPAMQIGPRTFIAAAHCTPLLEKRTLLEIRGPLGKQTAAFKVVSQPVIADDDSFSGERCQQIFANIANGNTLSEEQLVSCWFQDGASDIALLITDHDISGPMASLATKPIIEGERLNLLGWSPICDGDLGFYRSLPFKQLNFTGSQVVFSGQDIGISGISSSACMGDSGGIYFRETSEGSIEIAAIHTGGTRDVDFTVELNGKMVVVPGHYAGGTDLSSPIPTAWLRTAAKSENLKICGLNLDCDGIVFPPHQ